MIDSITRITLNLQETNTMVSIRAKRGDTGRKLLIHLSDGSIPYHISDDCYATFTAKKPDGTKINNACTIENNVIEYEFTEQTCTAAGTMKAEIRLYGADNKMITSACFLINVYDTVFRDGDEVDSEGEMNTLDDLILRANAFLNETGKLLRWQGNWDSETEYEANDLVLHEDVLYVAEEAIPAGTAPGSEEVTAWVPIAGMGTGNGENIDLTDQVKRAETAATEAETASKNANTAMTTANIYRANAKTSETNAANSATRAEKAAAKAEKAVESIPNSGSNAGCVVQDTAPEDTSVLWVDPTDNSDDGFQEAVNAALAQAKTSGEFDGKDGYTPQKNVDYFDGKDGYTPQKGKDYFDGDDYVLTPADKEEIAELAAELVEVPEGSGGGIAVTGATVGQTVKISAVDENGVPTAWAPTDFPSGGSVIGSGGEWELIGEVTSDGNGDSGGLYLAVDFKAYKDIHVEAVETADAITFRLIISKTKNWYDGQILVMRNDSGVQMHSAFIWVIDGRLKIISGSNSGYSADGRIELNNTPRNFFLTDDFNFVRFDANGAVVPEGATLKVWGRK